MAILGIYGSPRAGGNSDILLDKALEAAEQTGKQVERAYVRRMIFDACTECGSCDSTGRCILKDDMIPFYDRMNEAEAIIVATPIFFYGPPAMLKALMDRSQALWCGRALRKPKDQWKDYQKGPGYILAVGATKGDNLFIPLDLMFKYFYDALDRKYADGLKLRRVDGKGDVLNNPEMLEQAAELGRKIVSEISGTR